MTKTTIISLVFAALIAAPAAAAPKVAKPVRIVKSVTALSGKAAFKKRRLTAPWKRSKLKLPGMTTAEDIDYQVDGADAIYENDINLGPVDQLEKNYDPNAKMKKEEPVVEYEHPKDMPKKAARAAVIKDIIFWNPRWPTLKREMWFGTAPFCGGGKDDCTKRGMTYVKSDSRGDGKKCFTGKKVLCRTTKPGCQVPYVIASNMPAAKRTHILDAIKRMNATGYVNLYPRKNEGSHISFRFNGDDGCNSPIGRNFIGANTVNIPNWCPTGSIMHEILHSLGVYHEQSRRDRDSHVTIFKANIEKGQEHNFRKGNFIDTTDVGAYDYGSIMHYGSKAFSKNGKDTIVPKKAGVTIGQREKLSAGDLRALRYLCQ